MKTYIAKNKNYNKFYDLDKLLKKKCPDVMSSLENIRKLLFLKLWILTHFSQKDFGNIFEIHAKITTETL